MDILPIITTIISTTFAIIFGAFALRRNTKEDDESNATKMTTVLIKLENIGTGISEIKAELNNVREEQKNTREDIIVLQQNVKAQWHDIDDLKKITGLSK